MRKTLVWLVISAAFIGPGTVTIATKAGAEYGTALSWTIVFAVIACILLQEASARISIASGEPLGAAIIKQFSPNKSGFSLGIWLTFSIVIGSAAYEAGNILGAVAGVSLITNITPALITIAIVLIAGVLLYLKKFQVLTTFLGAIVGIMGLGLMLIVITLPIDVAATAKHLFIPQIIPGSELLVLGLIGTTVVPYNIFLGSRLAESQSVIQMRRGLIISVLIGGVISFCLILIGSQVQGDFSFSAVAAAITTSAGSWGAPLFAFGLFSAGLTSVITAPWAAAVMFTSTIQTKNKNRTFSLTWGFVLLTGLIFGVLNIQPIPVIILAQALNGILLPFITIALLFMLNNIGLMHNYLNTLWGNLGLLCVLLLTTIIGLINILKATNRAFGNLTSLNSSTLQIIFLLSLAITLTTAIWLRNYRKKQNAD